MTVITIHGVEHRLYTTRRAAVRAARQACRVALDAPVFEAYEGPDYEIHPNSAWWQDERFYFKLRGPALDEATAKRGQGVQSNG